MAPDDLQHSFVSIEVTRVDARIASDGGVEYAEAPEERQPDRSPEQVCEICFVPLDPHSINSPCNGPTIPDTLEGMTG